MSKVKKQNRKRFKAFRRNNGWIGIIFLALAYLGMVIIVFAFTDIMSQYVMNAKLVAEVERVAEIVEIYNNSDPRTTSGYAASSERFFTTPVRYLWQR